MDYLLRLLMCFLVTGSVASKLVVRSSSPVTSFVGDRTELTCSFSPSSSPGSSFAWSLDGRNGFSEQMRLCDGEDCDSTRHQSVISDENGTGRMKIIILDTVLSDAGNYTCLVLNNHDAQSAVVNLNVTECTVHRPTVDCDDRINLNSFMDLTCSYLTPDQTLGEFTRIAKIFLSPSLRPVYTSSLPGFEIHVNVTRDSIPNATEVAADLRLTSQCCRTQSSLACRPPDGQNVCSDVCSTDVFYPPSDLVLTRSPSGPWREGWRNASLGCRSNGFPPPRVSWRKVQEDTSLFLANGTGSSWLLIAEVHRNHSGDYRCEADLAAQRTTTISVHYPPDIDRRVPIIRANEGTIATLSCLVDANPSTSSMITWSTPNQSQVTTSTFRRLSKTKLESRLQVAENVHRYVFGNYTCTAINTLGADSFVIQLTGYCFPDPPQDLQVISSSKTSLTFSWTPGQDGGKPMTFAVSYCVNVTQEERCRKEQGITDWQFILDGLRTYTQYRITVRAENEVGSSDGVDIFASTAPGTVDELGIRATYEMKTGRLDISSTESDTSDLCIHAEFHVGGLRKMNETCLLPGRTVYITNGAREHQLWLVVCGRGVCSASTRVEYLDGSDGRWSLLFILVVSLGCCLGVTVLVILFYWLCRVTKERRWNSTDFDGMSTIQRALPLPPACALAIGIGPNSFKNEDSELQNYDAILNIKGKEISDNQHNSNINTSGKAITQSALKIAHEEPFPPTPEGYMKMDAGKTVGAPDQGIYTTHLHLIQDGPKEAEGIPYGNAAIVQTCQNWTPKAMDKPVQLPHIEVNDDTYTVAEHNKEAPSDYMVPTSPGCDSVHDTAL
ncbi:uncharacterized protein LOC129258760 [Lytechinus pictus]|uniref:uncharacterized protein LOC129258760 n=1 Tax=Lytechinus pictus TaxID=7653 RepID=UPI0030B9DD52